MAKDPAVLFYTSDFLSGVSFFTMEQRGQYITLLCEQHQHGSIPESHMKNICGTLESPVVSKFIKDDAGNYFNARMREEAIKRKKFCESRSNNRSNSNKYKTSEETYVKTHESHMNKHMENENEDVNKDRNRNKGFDFSICPEWMVEPLKNWLQYKKEKKQAYKETGFIALVKSLEKKFAGGAALSDAINYSMANNYSGIFQKTETSVRDTPKRLPANMRPSDL